MKSKKCFYEICFNALEWYRPVSFLKQQKIADPFLTPYLLKEVRKVKNAFKNDWFEWLNDRMISINDNDDYRKILFIKHQINTYPLRILRFPN